MTPSNEYSIQQHIHRFSVWTAARAASRSRLKNSEVEAIIHHIRLEEQIAALRNQQELTSAAYAEWLKKTGEQCIAFVQTSTFGDYQKRYFSFGLAAKMIAIYIKTTEIIPSRGESMLSTIAHPPVDSILLSNIKRQFPGLTIPTNWSTFSCQKYFEVYAQIEKYNSGNPSWKLERWWSVSKNNDDE